jgi:hypothetical protein
MVEAVRISGNDGISGLDEGLAVSSAMGSIEISLKSARRITYKGFITTW